MHRSRIAVISIAGLAVLAVAGAILLWGIVRLPWFERHAGEWLSRQLDTPVTVGRLAIGYFPTPSIDIGELVIASGSETQAPALMQLDRARLALPWRTLLGGTLRVTRLELDAPMLRLGVDAEGRGNWEPLAERLASLGGDEPAAWSLGALEIRDGSVDYRDARDGTIFELTGVAFTATDLAPQAYFPLQLRLAGHGPDVVTHASLTGEGMLDPERDVYAARGLDYRGWLGGLGLRTGGAELAGALETLRTDRAAGTATLEGLSFEGLGLRLAGRADIADFETEPRISFEFSTEPFAPRALANSLNRPLPDTTDPTALARATIFTQGSYAAGGLTLERIEGEFDDTRVTGSLIWPVTGPAKVQLGFDRIDLDRYLPPGTDTPGAPQATLESLLGDLARLDVDADLRFAQARSSGITARGLRVVIEPGRPGDKQ
jgi:hypothetical protein